MPTINDILKSHLENVKTNIAERMAASGRNASGKSVASLRVEVSDGHGILWGSKAFLAMERGRGPGAIPMGFVEIIMAWAKAKGISAHSKAGVRQDKDTAMRSFAGAVAYNIMKKGTRLFRNKQYNDIYTSVLKEELDKMSEAMVINLLDQVSTINDNVE